MESPATPARTLRFDQLSVEQGLAQEWVTSITQDQNGYMWFGSQNGLSRFDGYRFTVYKNIPGDTRSLIDDRVQALYVDEKKQLWVGTHSGLQRYDANQESFTSFLLDSTTKSDSGKRNVQTIMSDGHGKLWIGTDDGLQHFDPDTGSFSMMSHDLTADVNPDDGRVTALAQDAAGNLWIGTGAGVDLLMRGSTHFRHFRLDDPKLPNPAKNEVQALFIDSEQSLWIATTSGLVERWKLGTDSMDKRLLGPADGLGLNSGAGMDAVIFQDHDRNLWLGNSKGLHRWDADADRFISFPDDRSNPSSREVSALYQDRTGSLWIGSWTSGVRHVDLASGGFNRYFHIPADPYSLNSNRVYCITGDGQGHLVLGSFGNLTRLDPKSGKAINFGADSKHRKGVLEGEAVLAVYRDRRDQLWVGTGRGLGRFDPVTGNILPRSFHTGDPASDVITHIAGDREGNIWVASHGGLHLFDPVTEKAGKSFRHDVNDPASLANNSVKMTLEDSHGLLWVATDGGLDLLDRQTDRFTHFSHLSNDKNSLSNDRVQYLFEDKQHTLWVGTHDGLNRVEKRSDGAIFFHGYTANDGLGNGSIGGILEDEGGQLWVSTATGISSIDTVAGRIRNYTVHDGMIAGYYFAGSAFQDKEGTMYFGGLNGLTAFRPKDIHDNPYPPTVRVTDVRVAGLPVREGQDSDGIALSSREIPSPTLTLSYRHPVFSLEFSALHYADTQRNQFAYQLQGFDKDWIAANAGTRVVTYTNLDPGHYVFHVKAANKDGVWNETGAALAVTITPPFWREWWFRAGVMLLLASAIWLAHRARIRRLTDQKSRLESLVNMRTSEVVQQKEIVERKNELLQTAQKQLQHYFEDRERLLVSISHDLRTPITRLQLRAGLLDDDSISEEFHNDLDELEMMVKSALQYVKGTDIHETSVEVRLDTLITRMIRGAQLSGHEVSYEKSGLSVTAKPLALKRAIGNLLDNALWYGERAEISARACDGYVEIQIRDHGPGVDEEALGNLFESFVRLEHGQAKNENGMGLGLGIALDIVRAHGGELFLENQSEGGLVATIRLPAR